MTDRWMDRQIEVYKTKRPGKVTKGMGINEGEIFKDWALGHSNIKKLKGRDFPGGPVVKTPRFYCREHRFYPWSGN